MNSTNNSPCGIVIADKPQGFTSFDLCAKLRGMLHQRHIGHAGTLDPMATGIMVILLGNAARAAELLPDHTKSYIAGFELGYATDTLDITGNVTERAGISVSREALENALREFRGEISQLPPMYSAVHVGGERLYKLARQGVEVEREPRTVNIARLELAEFDQSCGKGVIEVECSKGTYIRTLIDDIGHAVGSAAVMSSLRRTAACGFTEKDAHTLEELQAAADRGELDRYILPVDSALDCYKECYVSEKQAQRYRSGGGLSMARLNGLCANEGELVRVYAPDGFIGIGRVAIPHEECDGSLELAPYKRLSV